MPIPHPSVTDVIAHLPTPLRIDRRRRINRIVWDEAGRLQDRYGFAGALAVARRKTLAYAAATDLSALGRTRHAIASKVFRMLRDQCDKPAGMNGYEWAETERDR